MFVGAGMPVDEGVVEDELRNAVKEELCQLIKNLSGKQGGSGESANGSR